MTLPYYAAALVALVATLRVITCVNAVHALLYLVVSLLSVAVIFYSLGAHFAAALEIIIYAGAIMVLFLFVLMMLNIGEAAVEQERNWLSPGVWRGPALLALLLLLPLVYALFGGEEIEARGHVVDAKSVGMALFGPYILVVELASLLLLAGMAGAWHLAQDPPDERERGEGGR